MFTLLRPKKNSLPFDLIAVHESQIQDMFLYFEKGPFVRKKRRNARKAVKAAIRFAKKKKTYPSIKTGEALNVLGELNDEIEYTQKVIQAAFVEAETAIEMIKHEKIDETVHLIEKARERFKNDDFQGGMELLEDVQGKLKVRYLEKSRMTIFGGFSSDIKKIKHELNERLSRISGRTKPKLSY